MDGTSLSGNVATDRVCPTTDTNGCSNTQEFVAISSASGLGEDEDGILGMWAGNTGSSDETEMLMPNLVADSTISDNIFSFYMTDTDGQSYIDFGAIDSSVVTNSGDVVYIDSESSEWWKNQVTGFRWGPEHDDDTEYVITPGDDDITDTGTSCILGPRRYMKYIRSVILNKFSSDNRLRFSSWKRDYIFDCSLADEMPSFDLLYGDYWFQVNPEDYVVNWYVDGSKCSLCL